MNFPSRQFQRLVCAITVCMGFVTGCSFWNPNQETGPTETWSDVFGTQGPEVVDANRSSLSTVVLQVAHLEQPLTDISMIDLLWKEVDQIGALDSQTRQKLSENGFRVGITGPNMPRTLENLLQVDAAWREERSDGQQGSTLQAVTMFPGEPTHLHTGQAYAECEINVPTVSGAETIKFENATCQFQIEADQLQEGWVKLHFIPEIHHDAQSLRRVATDEGWKFSNTQKVLPVYDQKFTLTLNRGEVAILSATENKPGTLGHAMFIGDGKNDQIQKVIVIRLAEIQKARRKLSRERNF